MPQNLNKSSLPAIHTIWIGGPLGRLEQLCIASWLRQGHEVVVHSYDKISLPDGAKPFNASALCPVEKVFRNRNGSLAPFCDIYRALILQTYPVLWLDIDIFLLRPFDFDSASILVREGNDANAKINNSAMRLPTDHPILIEILDRWHHPWKAIPWTKPRKAWPVLTMGISTLGLHAKHLPWGALGSLAIEKSIMKNGFDGIVVSHEYSLTAHRVDLFSPLPDPDVFLQSPVIYVHLYRSQLNSGNDEPNPGSIYARLREIAISEA